MSIRRPAVAGSFYPSDPQELRGLIKKFLSVVELPKIQGEVRALIVPHAGLIYSGQTAAYGYEELRKVRNMRKMRPPASAMLKALRAGKLQNFILLGPSHRVGFEGVAQDTHEWWGTPLGKAKCYQLPATRLRQGFDGQARFKLQGKEKELIVNDSRPHLQEHSLEVQLPFLQVLAKDTPEVTHSGSSGVEENKKSFGFTITPLLTGFDVDYEKLGELLAGNWRLGTGDCLIISSDLSHYHPQDIAEKIDKKTIQAILDLDTKTLEKEECEACGKAGILTAVYLAKKLGWKPKLLHYETSGDVTADFSQVVGYVSIAFLSNA